MSNKRPTLIGLLKHLRAVNNDWFMIGVTLGIEIDHLRGIEASYNQQQGRCMTEMIQYWLDTNPEACWEQVVSALEQGNHITLASTIKQHHLWNQEQPTAEGSPPTSPRDVESMTSITAEIKADGKIVRQLRELGSEFTIMLTRFRQLQLADDDFETVKFSLKQLSGTRDFEECESIGAIVNRLCHKHVDTFNVFLLEKVALCLNRDDMISLIKQYEKKKEQFFNETTVLEFQKAVVNKAKPSLSKEKVEVAIKVQKRLASERVLKDMDLLAVELFEDNQNQFLSFHAMPGSVIVVWHAPETLRKTLEQLVHQKTAILRDIGVEKVTIGEKCVFTTEEKAITEYSQALDLYPMSDDEVNQAQDQSTPDDSLLEEEHAYYAEPGTPCTSRTCAHVKQRQAAEINQLKSQLQLLGDDMTEKAVLSTQILPMKETFLQRMVEYHDKELVKLLLENEPASDIKLLSKLETELTSDKLLTKLETELASDKLLSELDSVTTRLLTAAKKELSTVSSSILNDLSCEVDQATSYTSPANLKYCITTTAQPEMDTVVCEIPSLEAGDRSISTITGLNGPWGVAVSKSGDIVVSEYSNDQISVLRKGSTITKFGCSGSGMGQFDGPQGVAITNDDHVLVADRYNHRIQMFTMEGEFVRSAGEEGNGPLQFHLPSGIAVGSSGLVFVLDSGNHRVQVLHPDLSLSHVFSSYGSKPGQLISPRDIACGSSDKVYVTDFGNHRVQIFSTDGQFISTCSKDDQPEQDQLFHPTGICVDSTGTVYVTDYNNTVSGFNSSGEFLSCLETNNPRGVGMNSTTGNMYVCDFANNRIIVY